MAKTTISVDSRVRDRLAALAARHGRPLGEEIEVLLDIAEQGEFWLRVSAGYAHDPAVAAHDEFPEYADLPVSPPLPTPPEMLDDVPSTVADGPAT
jgi:hypothetical protein